MTKLDAVNEILEGVGQPPVTALGSTGTWPSLTYDTSEQGSAERILDRECKRVMGEGGTGWGWACSELRRYRIRVPLYQFAYAAADPAFTFGETLTETTSGATLQFNYIDATNNLLYAGLISGTPTGGVNLTGGTSAVVKASTALTILTQGKIAFDPTWIKFRPAEEYESKRLAFVTTTTGSFIRDMFPNTGNDNPPQEGMFTSDVYVDAVQNLEFTTLPHMLAAYVVQLAAIRYQRFVRGSQQDDQELGQQFASARGHAMREDSEMRQLNVLDSSDAYTGRGDRLRTRMDQWQ